MKTKLVPLIGKRGIGQFTLIDERDYEHVIQYQWYIGNGYVVATIDHQLIYLHKFILGITTEQRADHKNRNTLDNRRSNLRAASAMENAQNRSVRDDKYKGVFLEKSTNYYRSIIRVNKVAINLGVFDSPLDAAYAYDEAALQYFGEFASTNFPPNQHEYERIRTELYARPFKKPHTKQAASSSFRGVRRNYGRGKPWRAYIRREGRIIHLGMFDSEQEAAHAYVQAKLKFHAKKH